MEQFRLRWIDSRLAVIYEHMIYQDMIDERAAKVLPAILASCIICEEPGMKYMWSSAVKSCRMRKHMSGKGRGIRSGPFRPYDLNVPGCLWKPVSG